MNRLFGRLRPTHPDAASSETHAPIPPEVARRLIPDNTDDPLFPKFRTYGKGKPGVVEASSGWWVIRDERGRVAGGAVVGDLGSDHPVSIDVAVDPARRRQGWATRLYAALRQRGVDMEAASAASLAHGTMTLDGYLFMRGRREKTEPQAEAMIVATAGLCPGCGPLNEHGDPVRRGDDVERGQQSKIDGRPM